jgi:hypothetical protein
MNGDRDRGTASAKSLSEPGHCLLLLRSPTDREIYDAFRAIATYAKRGCREHLSVEGDLSLTAGLSTPEVPGTIERLLDAEADMIDRLELEFGGLRWTYLRSGGHPPFRESFFDEMHIQQTDALAIPDKQLHDLIDRTISQLPIATLDGAGRLFNLITEVLEHARHADRQSSASHGEKHL